jgi:hypothetical protein
MNKNEMEALRKISEPVSVVSLADIRRVLLPLLSNKPANQVSFECSMSWQAEGENGIDNIKGISNEVSLLRLLIDGFDMVRKQIVVFEKAKAAYDEAKNIDDSIKIDLSAWDVSGMHFNVDQLIKRRLGGKRHELRVRWIVPEGVFEFDPYLRRLYKVSDNSEV